MKKQKTAIKGLTIKVKINHNTYIEFPADTPKKAQNERVNAYLDKLEERNKPKKRR